MVKTPGSRWARGVLKYPEPWCGCRGWRRPGGDLNRLRPSPLAASLGLDHFTSCSQVLRLEGARPPSLTFCSVAPGTPALRNRFPRLSTVARASPYKGQGAGASTSPSCAQEHQASLNLCLGRRQAPQLLACSVWESLLELPHAVTLRQDIWS